VAFKTIVHGSGKVLTGEMNSCGIDNVSANSLAP